MSPARFSRSVALLRRLAKECKSEDYLFGDVDKECNGRIPVQLHSTAARSPGKLH